MAMLIDINTKTPIEKIGNWYFKREDKFKPFAYSDVNGSKLRQCLCLCEKYKEEIKKGIITGTSLLSPQAVITSACAKYYGVPCTIVYGGTKEESLKKMKYPMLAKSYGADIKILANTGRTSVLNNRIKAYNTDKNMYVIHYGFDLKNNIDCYIPAVAGQVENIPDNIENIYVTCGSSITLCGILYGISLYKKSNITKVVAIGVAPNRTKKIKEYCELIEQTNKIKPAIDLLEYVDAFNLYKGYKYENKRKTNYNGIDFHDRYEAKTFDYANANADFSKDNNLFWIIGGNI